VEKQELKKRITSLVKEISGRYPFVKSYWVSLQEENKSYLLVLAYIVELDSGAKTLTLSSSLAEDDLLDEVFLLDLLRKIEDLSCKVLNDLDRFNQILKRRQVGVI